MFYVEEVHFRNLIRRKVYFYSCTQEQFVYSESQKTWEFSDDIKVIYFA